MVVISIIGLLSSIVLVALKDVRQKAQATKLRAEVDQLINALELYKADKGVYPGQRSTSFGFAGYGNELTGTTEYLASPSTPGFENSNAYKTALSPYIKYFPKFDAGVWLHYGNNYVLDCSGDTASSSYFIRVSSQQPGFEDWPYARNLGVELTGWRCFSFK